MVFSKIKIANYCNKQQVKNGAKKIEIHNSTIDKNRNKFKF